MDTGMDKIFVDNSAGGKIPYVLVKGPVENLCTNFSGKLVTILTLGCIKVAQAMGHDWFIEPSLTYTEKASGVPCPAWLNPSSKHLQDWCKKCEVKTLELAAHSQSVLMKWQFGNGPWKKSSDIVVNIVSLRLPVDAKTGVGEVAVLTRPKSIPNMVDTKPPPAPKAKAAAKSAASKQGNDLSKHLLA